MATPAHERERADAPPNVLRQIWQDVYREGAAAGLVPMPPPTATVAYDPAVYRAVYTAWLRARHVTVVDVDRVLPASGSVYDIGDIAGELVPAPDEVERIIRIVDAELLA
jgi:hypothetical protein